MQKLVFGLLLLLASSRVDAEDLCISVMSDPDNRPLNHNEQLIVEPLPVYPRRPQSEHGYVDVEFEITTAGTVRDPIVLTSIPPGLFDEAALDAVLMFRYKPRIVDGRPVVVEGVQKRISFIPSGQDEPEEGKSAKQKKKQAQAVSKKVYDEILQAQEKVDAEDYNGALPVLENLLQFDKLSEYERSNVLNYIGFVHYNMGNVPGAIATYEEMLRIPSLEEQIRKQTVYTLAQLNTLEKRYTHAIRILEEWFTLELNPAPDSYILYAQNLYKINRYRDMIKPVETAIRIAEKRKKPVNEDWYGLLRYANSGIEEFQTALDIWKELNERWPSEKNSHGLARMYMRLGDKKKALAVFRELLVSWPETDYLTPLHLAAAEGDTTLVAELLANGASANLQSKDHRTPLYWAVEFGQAEATKMLIDANADVLLMAYPDRQSEVGKLVIDANADVHAMADEDWTPLHAAANSGDASIVEILIAAGAHVNAKADEDWTPLHVAANSGDASIVEILIAAGADIDAKTEDSRTALHKAAREGFSTIVEMLISAGADVNAKDENDYTPLHSAAMSGDASVVEILIAAGAHVNAETEQDWAPLSYAAFDGHTAIAERLMAQDANVAGLEIVAEAGSANAQFLLGSLYEQGHGVQQDDSLALRWYRAAAELNNADAAYALGEMYLDGRGIRTNAKKAAQWFQAAAHQGHRNAQVKLSELYRNGVGVRKDPHEASMWSCLAGV